MTPFAKAARSAFAAKLSDIWATWDVISFACLQSRMTTAEASSRKSVASRKQSISVPYVVSNEDGTALISEIK